MTDTRSLPERMIHSIWSELTHAGFGHLDRVRRYLFNMLDGREAPPPHSDRELFRFMYVPGLTPGPFYEIDALTLSAGHDELSAICNEARLALSQRALVTDHSDLVVGNTVSAQAGWDCRYFRREFSDIVETHQLFPGTSAYLRRQRLATEALYSRLAPHTSIEPHSDCANYVTTVHLPLCDHPSILCVAGESRVYSEGKIMLFDSSFTHSVQNPSDTPRDILLFNIWHPDLSDEEVHAIDLIRRSWKSSVRFDPDNGFG